MICLQQENKSKPCGYPTVHLDIFYHDDVTAINAFCVTDPLSPPSLEFFVIAIIPNGQTIDQTVDFPVICDAMALL